MVAKCCIIKFCNISRESRTLHQAAYLKDFYHITVIGFGDHIPVKGVKFISIRKSRRGFLYKAKMILFIIIGMLIHSFYRKAFWLKPEYHQAVEVLKEGKFDIIQANDWEALPVAVKAAKDAGSKVIFDAHEYTPFQINKDFLSSFFQKPFLEYVLSVYGAEVNNFIDASDGFTPLYKEKFDWNPTTIRNVPFYRGVKFNPINPSRIGLIHHGAAVPSRKQEKMIEMMTYVDDRYHLFLMLVGGNYSSYLEKLKSYAINIAPGRITFLPAVNPKDIIENITSYDIGLPFINWTQRNQLFSQPNKFFDYIMAGLAIITTPQFGMKGIIENYKLGKITTSYDIREVANVLNNINSDEINDYKRNSLSAAKTFHVGVELKKLQALYEKILA